jgi:outer membrane protein assembly factor BamD
MRLKIYIVLIISLLVSSCSEYDKLLKSTDFELKKTKAIAYFNNGQFVKATELFTQIIPRYRATEEAEELSWMNAQSYFGMKDYLMAGSQFKTFTDLYPFGKHVEEAYYMAAICDFHQSPRAELDQDNTRNAIEGFNFFLKKFPASKKLEECNAHIKELEEKLVEKSYMSARLYYDMKQYKAAVLALNNSLKEFPQTKYREEMMYLKLNSLFLYAEYSIANKQKERYQAALDDYYSFMEEFPEGTYSKEVRKIYQTTAGFLKISTDNSNIK